MAYDSEVTKQLLKALSVIDNRKLLAAHLPTGRIWTKAFDSDSNLGALIMGLAAEYYRLGILIEKVNTELDIDETNELLIKWETSVGIPNEYFLVTNTSLEQRRKNLKMLFTNFGGVQTLPDFQRVADYYGYEVIITSGMPTGAFPLAFPLLFFSSSKAVKHTIIIIALTASTTGFPLTFPVAIASPDFLKTVFELLAPANCAIVKVYRPDIFAAYGFTDINTDYVFTDIGTEYVFTDLSII